MIQHGMVVGKIETPGYGGIDRWDADALELDSLFPLDQLQPR